MGERYISFIDNLVDILTRRRNLLLSKRDERHGPGAARPHWVIFGLRR